MRSHRYLLRDQRERQEQLQRDSEALAERRRIAREEAQKWTADYKDSDDEKEGKKKKPRARARPDTAVSGDEGEPKKKRRGGKLKKANDGGDDAEALFSGDEDGDTKPAAKKVCQVHVLSFNKNAHRYVPANQEASRARRRRRRGGIFRSTEEADVRIHSAVDSVSLC